MRFALFLTLALLARTAVAQTNDSPVPASPTPVAQKPASSVKPSRSAVTAAELQKAVDQLTQSNRDLLDLLKKQQEVLQDMQYESRLKNRQIESLEEKLENSLYENT